MQAATVSAMQALGQVDELPPDHVYVGRRMPRHRCRAVRQGSPLGNPFRPREGEPPGECLRKYVAHVRSRPDLLALLPKLRGKVLVCWCCKSDIPVAEEPDRVCHAECLCDLIEGREPPI
jgi:hypothetical protein